MLSIIIAEDNPHFSNALSQIILEIPGAKLLRCYTDAESAIEEISAFSPNIVITDIQLKGKLTGIDIINKIKPALPATEFLVCTVHDDSSLVFDALRSGATGYILKEATIDEIKNAILEVANGGSPMSPFIARKVIASFYADKPIRDNPVNHLTTREKEVLQLLAKGLLYKEIAEQLLITHATVKKHIRNIYEKLHVQNKVEALNKLRLL